MVRLSAGGTGVLFCRIFEGSLLMGVSTTVNLLMASLDTWDWISITPTSGGSGNGGQFSSLKYSTGFWIGLVEASENGITRYAQLGSVVLELDRISPECCEGSREAAQSFPCVPGCDRVFFGYSWMQHGGCGFHCAYCSMSSGDRDSRFVADQPSKTDVVSIRPERTVLALRPGELNMTYML